LGLVEDVGAEGFALGGGRPGMYLEAVAADTGIGKGSTESSVMLCIVDAFCIRSRSSRRAGISNFLTSW
jgi:hypothetical protein